MKNILGVLAILLLSSCGATRYEYADAVIDVYEDFADRYEKAGSAASFDEVEEAYHKCEEEAKKCKFELSDSYNALISDAATDEEAFRVKLDVATAEKYALQVYFHQQSVFFP